MNTKEAKNKGGIGLIIEIKLDDEQLKDLYLAEVQKRLDKLEVESLLMDSKKLCKFLSLSWPTVELLNRS